MHAIHYNSNLATNAEIPAIQIRYPHPKPKTKYMAELGRNFPKKYNETQLANPYKSPFEI
jgi:hypothetical protein